MSSLFAIIALDAEDTDALREQNRDGHIAHFKSHADRLAVAGPLSGSSPGSLVILEAEDEQDARAFIEADPFHPAGVWESIEIFPFKASSGRWTKA